MKRLGSILFIAIFSFAGFSSFLHLILEEKDYCSQTQDHFCADEAHHHCSLCDVVFNSDFLKSDNLVSIFNCEWNIEEASYAENIFAVQQPAELSRAPPSRMA